MDVNAWWGVYLLLGAFVGFFAGLLGIGGGGIMVPVLTSMFMMQGFAAEHVVHLALGTSMAAIILTSVSSIYAHHCHGAIQWSIVKKIVPGILIGTFSGAFLTTFISSKALAVIFAVFMSYVALQMIVNARPQGARSLPGWSGMTAAGLVIGGISALVAIGGGSLSVPFMSWCQVRIQQAIATSAAIGFPIAVAGSVGYMMNGLGVDGLPDMSIGFIYVPALLLVSVLSVMTAPLGARLAHRLPVSVLKKIFALLLIALSLKMLSSVYA